MWAVWHSWHIFHSHCCITSTYCSISLLRLNSKKSIYTLFVNMKWILYDLFEIYLKVFNLGCFENFAHISQRHCCHQNKNCSYRYVTFMYGNDMRISLNFNCDFCHFLHREKTHDGVIFKFVALAHLLLSTPYTIKKG